MVHRASVRCSRVTGRLPSSRSSVVRVRSPLVPLAAFRRCCLSTPFCPASYAACRPAEWPMAESAAKYQPADSGSTGGPPGHAGPHTGIVRKDERFSLVKFVRGMVQSSPWLVIAVAAHVVVFAVLAVWTLGHGEKPKE